MDLETVYSQAAPCFLVATLQVTDDTVVYILLLLAQEVSRHSVEGVAAELVVALYGLQQVKLDASINGDLLVVIRAVGFAAKLSVPHTQLAAAAQEASEFKSCCVNHITIFQRKCSHLTKVHTSQPRKREKCAAS